jgi:hypothetical protein
MQWVKLARRHAADNGLGREIEGARGETQKITICSKKSVMGRHG